MHVDKVESVPAFQETAKKYFRRADKIVVQRFIYSRFNWRVTTLNGKVLSVCKYVMPGDSWKIQRNDNGYIVWAKIKAVDPDLADPRLLDVGVKASWVIGNVLYGVDIKEVDGEYVVIEVNDNPNVDAGGEDARNPEVYERIVCYLASEV